MRFRHLAVAIAFCVVLTCAAQANPQRHEKPGNQEREEPSMVPGSLSQAQLKAMREQEAATQKIIVAKEQALLDAEKRKDAKAILDKLADDFTELGSDGGVYFKSDVASALPSVEVKDSKMTEIRFRLLAKDVALLMYKLEVDASVGGHPIPRLHRVSTIWTRKNGEWLVRFHQGTLIPVASPTAEKH